MSSAKETIPIFPLLDNQNDSNSNWLTNLTAEEIGQMQHSDNVIMTIFNLKERFANKPPKHVVKNCSFKVRILWSSGSLLLFKMVYCTGNTLEQGEMKLKTCNL